MLIGMTSALHFCRMKAPQAST